MSNTFKVFLDKMGGSDVTKYIGRKGEIFYDPVTGFQRLSDGVTPGGTLLNMIGRQGYCGAFYDTTTQTNAAQINKVKFNQTYISDGVSVVGGTKITFAHAGRYNIQFSLQLDKGDSGTDDFDLWLLRNGESGPWTNTRVTLTGKSAKSVAAWNFVVEESAGTYIELAWYSLDANLFIHAEPPQTNPDRPGIPSAILTVTQV